MSFGVTSAGFVRKTLREIRESLRDELRTSPSWGESVNYDGDGAVAQLLDAFAGELDVVWQGMEGVYQAFDPDAAEGIGLENLAALDGLLRRDETPSAGSVTFSGTNGTVIPEGTTVRASGLDVLAVTTDAATISGGSAVVPVKTVETGAVVVGAGAIDTLVDVISGVSGVTNAAAFTVGLEVETDGELRERRALAQQSGAAGVDRALAAALRELEFVQQAQVISNRLDAVDGNGFPAHSLNPVLYPTTADTDELQAIATLLAGQAPGGVRVAGSTEYEVEDAFGYTDTYGWTFASAANIYLALTLTTTADYPDDGNDQVKTALETAGNALVVGEDVHPAQLLFALGAVPGIKTVALTLKIGAAPSGGDTGSLTIGVTQIARFDAANITVTP